MRQQFGGGLMAAFGIGAIDAFYGDCEQVWRLACGCSALRTEMRLRLRGPAQRVGRNAFRLLKMIGTTEATASEWHPAAHAPGPDAGVAADAAIFAAGGNLRAAAECRRNACRGASRPACKERHGGETGGERVVAREIIVAVEPGIGRELHGARPGERIAHLDAAAGPAGHEIAVALQGAEAVGVAVFM